MSPVLVVCLAAFILPALYSICPPVNESQPIYKLPEDPESTSRRLGGCEDNSNPRSDRLVDIAVTSQSSDDSDKSTSTEELDDTICADINNIQDGNKIEHSDNVSQTTSQVMSSARCSPEVSLTTLAPPETSSVSSSLSMSETLKSVHSPGHAGMACVGVCSKDDDTGHHIVEPGELLGESYIVVRTLGQGTYGTVVLAQDRFGSQVAIKIVSSDEACHSASEMELHYLRLIKEHAREQDTHCIVLLDDFYHSGHLCMVFDEIGESLGDLLCELQSCDTRHGLAEPDLRQFIFQLLSAIDVLHNQLGIIHSDIKPDNILIARPQWKERGTRSRRHLQLVADGVRMIDFGLATETQSPDPGCLGTCNYRAPEKILNIPYSQSSDMFSVGCAVFEAMTGCSLFQLPCDYIDADGIIQDEGSCNHLLLMEQVIGKMPIRVAKQGFKMRPTLFHCGGSSSKPRLNGDRLLWKTSDTLENALSRYCGPLLSDLLKKMLLWDPRKRISAKGALAHPYFRR